MAAGHATNPDPKLFLVQCVNPGPCKGTESRAFRLMRGADPDEVPKLWDERCVVVSASGSALDVSGMRRFETD